MIVIKEHFQGKKSYYNKMIIDSNGVVSFSEDVSFLLAKKNLEGNTFFILYDDDMVPIRPVFRYLNYEMSHLSYNSREQAAHALRLLYCFITLTKANIERLSKGDINNLKAFLLGYSPKMGNPSMNLKTQRRNTTVNDYLTIYRMYFDYMKISCKALSAGKVTDVITPGLEGTNAKSKYYNYDSSLKEGTPIRRVPKYISIEEFSRIIEIIRKDKNEQAEIIVRLMYQFGMRIGEVLGITNEDVAEVRIEGNLYPVIYLRNRASDDPKYQSAKSEMKIQDSEQYKIKDYSTEKLGFDKVYITYDFYNLLNDFIESNLSDAFRKHKKRFEKTKADKVVKSNHTSDNYYIFLNSLGSKLSAKSWNRYLKTVFKRAGIPIDSVIRKEGLNHRFRHGFAMFQVKYRNTDVMNLMEMMRHKNVSSTMIYYSPTEEDEYNIKTEFVTDLYDLIPSLKERPKLYE